jgi:hypothetical protein
LGIAFSLSLLGVIFLSYTGKIGKDGFENWFTYRSINVTLTLTINIMSSIITIKNIT